VPGGSSPAPTPAWIRRRNTASVSARRGPSIGSVTIMHPRGWSSALDVVVNNAGIATHAGLAETTPELFERRDRHRHERGMTA
jgi:NAD(P)-dependent dehydrogenase (short-subunit alcohol dehydrogenase family)